MLRPSKNSTILEKFLQNRTHDCQVNAQIKRVKRVEVHTPNVEVREVQEGRLRPARGRSRRGQSSGVWRLAGRGQASSQPSVGRLSNRADGVPPIPKFVNSSVSLRMLAEHLNAARTASP